MLLNRRERTYSAARYTRRTASFSSCGLRVERNARISMVERFVRLIASRSRYVDRTRSFMACLRYLYGSRWFAFLIAADTGLVTFRQYDVGSRRPIRSRWLSWLMR